MNTKELADELEKLYKAKPHLKEMDVITYEVYEKFKEISPPKELGEKRTEEAKKLLRREKLEAIREL